MIDGPTVAPAGRSMPPMVAGFIRVRTTIGITGCSRIDSLSTASSQASLSASPAVGRFLGAPQQLGARPTS